MSIGPSLYEELIPVGVWIQLHELEHPESDLRRVTLRVKPSGRRSVSAWVDVSRYSPEHQLITACSHAYGLLEVQQRKLTPENMREVLKHAVALYVDPF